MSESGQTPTTGVARDEVARNQWSRLTVDEDEVGRKLSAVLAFDGWEIDPCFGQCIEESKAEDGLRKMGFSDDLAKAILYRHRECGRLERHQDPRNGGRWLLCAAGRMSEWANAQRAVAKPETIVLLDRFLDKLVRWLEQTDPGIASPRDTPPAPGIATPTGNPAAVAHGDHGQAGGGNATPHEPRRPVCESKAVKLFGPGEQPEVNGKRKPTLTPARYDAVKALIAAGESGLTKDELDRNSGHGDARKTLKRLAENDRDWRKALSFPGTTGKRYRIR